MLKRLFKISCRSLCVLMAAAAVAAERAVIDLPQQAARAVPQSVKIGDVWVMFYFGAFWKPKAFDTFACSYDLVS